MAATVYASINYVGSMSERPCFHANDQSLDRVALDPRVVPIADARSSGKRPTLSAEGFELMTCPSVVADFRNAGELAAVHPEEIRRFVLEITGADAVDSGQPHHVPHSAFTDPRVPPDTLPRASIEMRTIAYWFD